MVNVTLINKKISLKSWAHGLSKRTIAGDRIIETGLLHVLLAKQGKSFKLANNEGWAIDTTERDIRQLIMIDDVANCSLSDNADELYLEDDWIQDTVKGNTKQSTSLDLQIEDCYTIQEDKEFEQETQARYTIFKNVLINQNTESRR